MKKLILLKIVFVLLFFAFYANVKAQDEILFEPSELSVTDSSYYIKGAWVDYDKDGVLDWYNGCYDAYECKSWEGYAVQENHHESGTDQGFKYENCMIMPDCPSKYEEDTIVPPIPRGYIQMAPCVYPGTDSASMSAIYSPPIMYLESLELALSVDVSIKPGEREIPFNIDISKDFGETWEDGFFINDICTERAGTWALYEEGHSIDFDMMIEASEEGPIIIRLYTNDRSIDAPLKGQFVKVHLITIWAELYEEETQVGIKQNNIDLTKYYSISDRSITSLKGLVSVYNPSGQLIGNGKIIAVQNAGIYFLKFENGYTQKVFIK